MDSQHARNIQRWIDHIEANKLKKSKYWAPINSFNRKFGIELPPSVFWSFSRTALTIGLGYGLLCGAGVSLFVLDPRQVPAMLTLKLVILSVVGYGVPMAWFLVRARKKLNLGTWEDFIKSGEKHVDHST